MGGYAYLPEAHCLYRHFKFYLLKAQKYKIPCGNTAYSLLIKREAYTKAREQKLIWESLFQQQPVFCLKCLQ